MRNLLLGAAIAAVAAYGNKTLDLGEASDYVSVTVTINGEQVIEKGTDVRCDVTLKKVETWSNKYEADIDCDDIEISGYIFN